MNRPGLLQHRFATLSLVGEIGCALPVCCRLKKAAEIVGGTMVLIVLAGVASVFYVYVLIHWIRDAKRKTTTRSASEIQANENYEPKRLIIIGSRKSAERSNRSTARSRQPASPAMRARSSGCCCHSASGMCTKRSQDRGAWPGKFDAVISHSAACDVSHIVRGVST